MTEFSIPSLDFPAINICKHNNMFRYSVSRTNSEKVMPMNDTLQPLLLRIQTNVDTKCPDKDKLRLTEYFISTCTK